MAIQASNISAAPNPSDPNGGTLVTFTRSDTPSTPVTISVSIAWTTNTPQQSLQAIKQAIQSYLAQANGIAAVNAAAVGQTV